MQGKHTKTVKRSAKPSQKMHVVTLTVTAGPYISAKKASTEHAKAARIKNTVVGKVTRTQAGYVFPIVQRFGARNMEEKSNIQRMIRSHREKAGVPTKHVHTSSKYMSV